MFDIGKRYEFEMIDPLDRDTVGYFSGVIIDVSLPLIKIRRDLEGDEKIINAANPSFLSARLSQNQV